MIDVLKQPDYLERFFGLNSIRGADLRILHLPQIPRRFWRPPHDSNFIGKYI
jgi:hypothetical protein